MNYKAHYDKLIERGQYTMIHGYRERHHIIPKCLGGTDDEDNLVYLTAEEHYVAHQLLVKMHPNNRKLIYAAKMMTIGNKTHGRKGNKLYGWLRQLFVANPPSIGYKHTQDAKDRMSTAHSGKKLSAESIRKRTASVTGMKRSQETLDRMSTAAQNRQYSEEETLRRSNQMREENKGKTPWNKGKENSYTMPKHTCIHCGKIVSMNMIIRFHNDMCKEQLFNYG